MQFSIPKWENVASYNSTGHQVFHIYLNGFLHCKSRFSHLHELHAKLKSIYPEVLEEIGAKFPPRRLMVLNTNELETRRDKLETYLQTLSQCVDITTGPELTSFLVKQQAQSFTIPKDKMTQPFQLTLPDFSPAMLSIDSSASSVMVLLNAAELLSIPKQFLFAFKLVLVELQEKVLIYQKLLLACECPALVLFSARLEKPSSKFAILIRKMLSSNEIEQQLLDNRVIAKLVADEIRQDLKYSFCLPRDSKNYPKAKLLEKSDEALLESMNKLRYCGYIRFQVCMANFPEDRTYVVPRFGRYEVCLEYNQRDGTRVCANLKVCRIKCWSVGELTEPNLYKQFSYKYELCFDYYLAHDKACLVKILTNEAVMMSLCIQQMIDEMTLINAQRGVEQVVLCDDYHIEIDHIKEETASLATLSSLENSSMPSTSNNTTCLECQNMQAAAGQSFVKERIGEQLHDSNDAQVLVQYDMNDGAWLQEHRAQYPKLSRLKESSLTKENETFLRANFDCDL
ncbi:sorting nexin-17-like [Convolutriloba macropyga]|uniref:sorting nexin-17-like n=1 Tax=Convolutriloba macropyga TaxID=536237 RepID=UPI003F5253AA